MSQYKMTERHLRLKARAVKNDSTRNIDLQLVDAADSPRFLVTFSAITVGMTNEQHNQISRQLQDAINAAGIVVTI